MVLTLRRHAAEVREAVDTADDKLDCHVLEVDELLTQHASSARRRLHAGRGAAARAK